MNAFNAMFVQFSLLSKFLYFTVQRVFALSMSHVSVCFAHVHFWSLCHLICILYTNIYATSFAQLICQKKVIASSELNMALLCLTA